MYFSIRSVRFCGQSNVIDQAYLMQSAQCRVHVKRSFSDLKVLPIAPFLSSRKEIQPTSSTAPCHEIECKMSPAASDVSWFLSSEAGVAWRPHRCLTVEEGHQLEMDSLCKRGKKYRKIYFNSNSTCVQLNVALFLDHELLQGYQLWVEAEI